MLQSIRRMPEVVEASMVTGGYDIIARVGADTMQKVKEITSWKIRKLDGVRTSLTLIGQAAKIQ